MDCPRCAAENPPHARFCHACGAALATGPVSCRACGQPNDPAARFCVHCGAADPAKPMAEPPSKMGKPQQAAWIVAGMAVLVVAGAGTAWWLAGRGAAKDGSGSSAATAAPASRAASAAQAPQPAAEETLPAVQPAEERGEAVAAPTPPKPAPRREEKPPAAQRQSPPPRAAPAPAPPARTPSGGGWYAEYLAAREACRQNSGNFFSRTACLEKAKWKYCNDGHWGEVPECPTGSTDNRP